MAGDVDNLAHLAKNVFSTYRHGGDLTLYALRRAITKVMSRFPVYRTYMDGEERRETDRAYIQKAVNLAVRNNPELWYEMNFIEKFLLLQFEEYLQEEGKRPWIHFVMRFQQYTAPLTAKGVEDTTFYIYNRLLSLNEVGGSPDQFGLPPEEVHRFFKHRAEHWPCALNATATHDTKRGEDSRARLNVLSELPREWDYYFQVWSKLNSRKKVTRNGLRIPDKNDEYFLYQTLLASYPLVEADCPGFLERIKAYIVKAVREAKVHTGWIKPDHEYENDFIHFVEKILKPGGPFLKAFLAFQRKISYYGMFNSLSQTAVKCTAPGIPDIYQGCELWDFSLVDPDNRRPVDYHCRAEILRDIAGRDNRAALLQELLASKEDGRIKLFLLHQLLRFRRRHAGLFQSGHYIPLETAGLFKENVFAFARVLGTHWSLTAVPRFLTQFIPEGQDPLTEEVWGNTSVVLPKNSPRAWRNILTGQEELKASGTLAAGVLFEQFPVALLEGEAIEEQKVENRK
jgi:(1->4)-alpha-D-glucan 1-alpha-D-glucosylmutase